MQNGVYRVRNGGLKSGIELGLGFNSTALFLRLPDSTLCLTGIFKSIIHTFSTYGKEKHVFQFLPMTILFLHFLNSFKVYKRL